MGIFDNPDWAELFRPTTPLIEIIIRGSATYLILFALIRGAFKRQSGAVGITDLLVIVLLADAAQNAMAGSYTSVTDGMLLVGTILAWAVGLDWAGYHVPLIQRLVHPPPLTLVEDGQMIRRNMRHELITEGELLSKLREQGVEDVGAVRHARIEGDGRVSVILRDERHARDGSAAGPGTT